MSPQQSALGFHIFPGSVEAGGEESRLEPSVILLLGWMDAPLSLLRKYVDAHRSLFPTSSIVLVESHSSFMWASSTGKEKNLRPVINMLVDKLYNTSHPTNGLLFMQFRMATGAIHLMTLASFLKRRLDAIYGPKLTTLPTITTAFIIDSTPGFNDYESIMTTFTLAMKSPILKSLARLPLTFAYVAYYLIYNKALNNPPLLPLLHNYLGQARLLPGSDDESPRLYIYSDADAMVPWTSVERHLSVLSERRMPFVAEKYIGTQHVSHAKQDPRRYWEAVHSLWRSALRQSNAPT
ncbi:hypothetical protein CPB84DRAFT_1846799 [Gymnopilus junonius]|uniref:Transmembrane protein 53 n=1 Tax=Gymnopilus junonius TaxID=109634 RepID=A0A9P5NP26_GYMJU|nr:hypothetical protein CPB84DRAFT_1846799 [Gymnopilus junonius]